MVYTYHLTFQVLSFEVSIASLERLRFTFTPNDKREFEPRDYVFCELSHALIVTT